MKIKLSAIIEKSNDGGYGIYIPELEDTSLFGYGLSENEAKKNLKENLDELLNFCEKENIPIPKQLNNGKVKFEFKYDFSGFFQAYPIFNVSELAKYLDVNSSLLRRYKQGLAFASPTQKEKIEKGIHLMAGKLGTIKF